MGLALIKRVKCQQDFEFSVYNRRITPKPFAVYLGHVGAGPVVAVQDVGLAASAQKKLKRRLAEEVKAHLKRGGSSGWGQGVRAREARAKKSN